MAIRWRDKDRKQISRAVGKFNAKLTRLSKKPEFSDSGFLPERKSVSDVIDTIKTRDDFNRAIKSIDRFFKKGATDIVAVNIGESDKPEYVYRTKYEISEVKRRQKTVQKKREQFRRDYKLTEDEALRLNVGDIDYKKELKSAFEKGDEQSWFNFIYSLERESSTEYFNDTIYKVRESYYKVLRNHIGGIDAEAIIFKLKKYNVSSADILLALAENDDFSFEFIYSLEEREAKINVLLGAIEKRFNPEEEEEE